jgi:small subunit ribosomal protein S9
VPTATLDIGSTAVAEPVVSPIDTPAEQRRRQRDRKQMPGGYWFGTGRRKTAVARVRIKPGEGKMTVNDRPGNEYFPILRHQRDIAAPLEVTETKKMDVFVNVVGGGPSGQAGAIRLGLARALAHYNHELEHTLRDNGFMTRDSRQVERKKYGRSGARRRFQFSKR